LCAACASGPTEGVCAGAWCGPEVEGPLEGLCGVFRH
jgi:hypothetical protein